MININNAIQEAVSRSKSLPEMEKNINDISSNNEVIDTTTSDVSNKEPITPKQLNVEVPPREKSNFKLTPLTNENGDTVKLAEYKEKKGKDIEHWEPNKSVINGSIQDAPIDENNKDIIEIKKVAKDNQGANISQGGLEKIMSLWGTESDYGSQLRKWFENNDPDTYENIMNIAKHHTEGHPYPYGDLAFSNPERKKRFNAAEKDKDNYFKTQEEKNKKSAAIDEAINQSNDNVKKAEKTSKKKKASDDEKQKANETIEAESKNIEELKKLQYFNNNIYFEKDDVARTNFYNSGMTINELKTYATKSELNDGQKNDLIKNRLGIDENSIVDFNNNPSKNLDNILNVASKAGANGEQVLKLLETNGILITDDVEDKVNNYFDNLQKETSEKENTATTQSATTQSATQASSNTNTTNNTTNNTTDNALRNKIKGFYSLGLPKSRIIEALSETYGGNIPDNVMKIIDEEAKNLNNIPSDVEGLSTYIKNAGSSFMFDSDESFDNYIDRLINKENREDERRRKEFISRKNEEQKNRSNGLIEGQKKELMDGDTKIEDINPLALYNKNVFGRAKNEELEGFAKTPTYKDLSKQTPEEREDFGKKLEEDIEENERNISNIKSNISILEKATDPYTPKTQEEKDFLNNAFTANKEAISKAKEASEATLSDMTKHLDEIINELSKDPYKIWVINGRKATGEEHIKAYQDDINKMKEVINQCDKYLYTYENFESSDEKNDKYLLFCETLLEQEYLKLKMGENINQQNKNLKSIVDKYDDISKYKSDRTEGLKNKLLFLADSFATNIENLSNAFFTAAGKSAPTSNKSNLSKLSGDLADEAIKNYSHNIQNALDNASEKAKDVTTRTDEDEYNSSDAAAISAKRKGYLETLKNEPTKALDTIYDSIKDKISDNEKLAFTELSNKLDIEKDTKLKKALATMRTDALKEALESSVKLISVDKLKELFPSLSSLNTDDIYSKALDAFVNIFKAYSLNK